MRLRYVPAMAGVVVLALITAGCGSVPTSPGATASGPTPPSPTAAGVTASPPTVPSPAPSVGSPATTFASGLPAASADTSPEPAARPYDPSATIGLELVAEGLQKPLFVGHAGDASGRLFVLEQGGRVRVVRDGRLVADPFLDIRDRVSNGGEQGLLGIAFAPTYATDGRFYVDYTDRGGTSVISEFVARDPSADRADPASERVLLRIAQPFANHNGGDLAIGPDGFLWIATGDGGSAGDPNDNAQRTDTLLGKLLRIDPRPAAGKPYTIPSENPFVGRAGARGEIWALGLRNPWRFSFDRLTGDLWIGDVGQATVEEVDHWPANAPGGPDFGWRRMEGSSCFRPSTGCARTGLVLPVAEYGHDQGCAVTGGYVYRGQAVPRLAGTYLYGDYCSGTIWGLDAASDTPAPRVLLDSGLAISSFGEDGSGELYVVDLGGRLFRVVAGRS